MAIIYSLSPKADLKGRSEVLIRYKSGKIAARAKSGVFITSDWYDFVIGKSATPIYKGKRLINDEMKEDEAYHNKQKTRLSAIVGIINEAVKTADTSTSDWLKLAIDKFNYPEKYIPKVAEPIFKTLFQFIEFFIENAPSRKDRKTGNPLTYNNIQQYKATEKHLKFFANCIGKVDFSFDEIDQEFYDEFVSYLQNSIQDTDEKGKPKFDKEKNPILIKECFTLNSVGKHIRILKLMLNEATTQGYNTSSYYNSFHVFTEDTDTIYLNEEELQQLKDTDLSKIPHLDRVRDWFLLLAWTGCRFSDLEKISKTDIKDGFITFRQQKTNTKVTIPLHPVVLEILNKYGFNMPESISNQRFNEYIKEATKIAEINSIEAITSTKGGKRILKKYSKWELISSHTGRRSFATNMYKRGIQTLTIMSITGHRTEKSFLKYIKVKQNEHAEMMAKAWENMYKQKN